MSCGITGATLTPTGTPAARSASIDLQAAVRRGRARVELARELAVEHRDRDEHADEPFRRHRRQQVEVALDQRALGRDRQRMFAFGEHLDDERVIFHSRSIGWYGSVLAPSAIGSQR